MYGAFITGGTLIGGAYGAINQHKAAQYDPKANKPKHYMANIGSEGIQGAMIGSGVYEITQAIAKSNIKTAGIVAGVSGAFGFIKGVKNQKYAAKHYNTPEYGPGIVKDDLGTLMHSGMRYGGTFAITGLGIYGALDVASSILRKSL